ncbi:MAG TPA: type II toxin-antitoxin system VapC family toxin [Vicinamibacterales bacterium]|nr:type II toxin-antitoxin system VapC family toxin [Vicinamibacterales bacterium]
MTSGADANASDVVPRLMLDTSAYSRFRAGDSRVHDLIARADAVIVPVPVLGELYGAFEAGGRPRENRVALADFLDEPFVSVTDVSEAVARQYGRIYGALRRAGTPVPVNDMWIAACAVDQGACLLTFDTDFDRIPGLDRIVLDGVEVDTDDEE